MKRETIMDLYYGRLNPFDLKLTEEEEYRKRSRNFLEASELFEKRLPKELREEYEKICEKEMRADEILLRDAFCKGFQTGLRLTAEALMTEE